MSYHPRLDTITHRFFGSFWSPYYLSSVKPLQSMKQLRYIRQTKHPFYKPNSYLITVGLGGDHYYDYKSENFFETFFCHSMSTYTT